MISNLDPHPDHTSLASVLSRATSPAGARAACQLPARLGCAWDPPLPPVCHAVRGPSPVAKQCTHCFIYPPALHGEVTYSNRW